MYWQRLKPYVMELLTFLLIIGVIGAAYAVGGEQRTRLRLLFLLLAASWLFWYIFDFALFALCVVSDLVLKNYETLDAVFLEQMIFRSTSFLDRNGKLEGGTVRIERKLFYELMVKLPEGIFVLTSSPVS